MRLQERKDHKKMVSKRLTRNFMNERLHRYSLRQRKLTECCVREPCQPTFWTLPCEIQLLILSYLRPCDLGVVQCVSPHFEALARNPILWKEYEIVDRKLETLSVINDLKRMPLLKKICIDNRNDCDRILKQISVSNKNLEQLHVTNCTGSLSSLYLKPGNLTRVLERCRRLHTVCFSNTLFRGVKFYRLLGDALPRLRIFHSSTTCLQLETLVAKIGHISEYDRELIGTLCACVARQSWLPIRYHATGNSHQLGFLYMDFRVADLSNNRLMRFVRPQS